MDAALKEFRKKLGERIKQRRTELEMEQLELAARINKDKQVINRYEKKGANPTAYILAAIAKELKLSIDELIDFSKLEADNATKSES